jgi:hypothetical protein
MNDDNDIKYISYLSKYIEITRDSFHLSVLDLDALIKCIFDSSCILPNIISDNNTIKLQTLKQIALKCLKVQFEIFRGPEPNPFNIYENNKITLYGCLSVLQGWINSLLIPEPPLERQDWYQLEKFRVYHKYVLIHIFKCHHSEIPEIFNIKDNPLSALSSNHREFLHQLKTSYHKGNDKKIEDFKIYKEGKGLNHENILEPTFFFNHPKLFDDYIQKIQPIKTQCIHKTSVSLQCPKETLNQISSLFRVNSNMSNYSLEQQNRMMVYIFDYAATQIRIVLENMYLNNEGLGQEKHINQQTPQPSSSSSSSAASSFSSLLPPIHHNNNNIKKKLLFSGIQFAKKRTTPFQEEEEEGEEDDDRSTRSITHSTTDHHSMIHSNNDNKLDKFKFISNNNSMNNINNKISITSSHQFMTNPRKRKNIETTSSIQQQNFTKPDLQNESIDQEKDEEEKKPQQQIHPPPAKIQKLAKHESNSTRLKIVPSSIQKQQNKLPPPPPLPLHPPPSFTPPPLSIDNEKRLKLLLDSQKRISKVCNYDMNLATELTNHLHLFISRKNFPDITSQSNCKSVVDVLIKEIEESPNLLKKLKKNEISIVNFLQNNYQENE